MWMYVNGVSMLDWCFSFNPIFDFNMSDNHQDPSNWKWGIFYFNKNDKRIFPPKRIKNLGWTINFANPYSILVYVLIVLAIWGLTSVLH